MNVLACASPNLVLFNSWLIPIDLTESYPMIMTVLYFFSYLCFGNSWYPISGFVY